VFAASGLGLFQNLKKFAHPCPALYYSILAGGFFSEICHSILIEHDETFKSCSQNALMSLCQKGTELQIAQLSQYLEWELRVCMTVTLE